MELKELFGEMHLEDLSEGIRSLFPTLELSCEDMLSMLLHGRLFDLVKYFLHAGSVGFQERLLGARSLFLYLLLLGILGAFLTEYVDLFERFHVGEMGFYFTYLLQTAILTRCFLGRMEVARNALGGVVTFVRLLMPTYLFSVGISTGTITASANHEMVLLMIYGVEKVLVGGFLPMIKSFFLLGILEGVHAKDRFDALLELMKKGLCWGLKAILGTMAGLSFLQSALTPVLDKLNGSVTRKIIGAIPGLGDGAEGAMELAISSAIVIKNGCGVLLMILLAVLCLEPLAELFAYCVAMKLAAALAGIVCDKRLTKAMDRAGETAMLLMGVVAEGMILFLMTLAVTCASVR